MDPPSHSSDFPAARLGHLGALWRGGPVLVAHGCHGHLHGRPRAHRRAGCRLLGPQVVSCRPELFGRAREPRRGARHQYEHGDRGLLPRGNGVWGTAASAVGLSLSSQFRSPGLVSRVANVMKTLPFPLLLYQKWTREPISLTVENGSAVVSEVLPRAWRGWAQTIVMLSNTLGLFGGLVIGGALNRSGDPNGFRRFFFIGMGFFLASGLMGIFAYRPPPRELQRLPVKEKLSRLDWVGYALLGSGLVIFCLGLFYSQNPYSWSDPHVAAPFAIGLALAIALCLYEYKFKTDGMFHHGLFEKDRNFAMVLICIFCEGIAFFAANQYFAYQVRQCSARAV